MITIKLSLVNIHHHTVNIFSCDNFWFLFYLLIGDLIKHFYIYVKNTSTCSLFLLLTKQKRWVQEHRTRLDSVSEQGH